ncbi:MAG: plasmid maintenance system killer [Novosphingobium sp. 16-62-11]|uniref:type II toxin-antitoxin system RelE/ParE family toxin n=1 Tax=Novosphingobium sp. 17-62-19 TaxID=1970406 RepID=UPI000BCD1D09|nr:type II toxin-antitoxin system RelE/ParE family toxin [Novosphingobium sp. 17-62-19]OYX95323.1 MAG: plasmid maintenance system killer [Novosphingobium sp. 35-62-5]OYZ45707.1 MAG: plasmid maintenance system killer [Novosphingobium sp. 16-62-11]OZA16468.1 MAG: plasmid maintenance system killer [Novosphingobium sp. 17-62-19]
MEIASIRHKALRRFATEGKAKGLIEPDRLRDMLAYIDAATSFEALALPPNFGLHPLTGDRAGTWAMTVTRNWRLTFTRIEDHAVGDLDLEDYH